MISIKNLRFQYRTGKELSFPDFSVPANSQCLLLGESGSGKTTLLHLVGGLLRSGQGVIEVNGTNLATLSESSLDRFRGNHIGFIFQKNHLIAALTVRQNILMAPFLGNLPQDINRVEETLKLLGLDGKADSRVSTLSQGQAQRVAIARAVVNRPSVILADEPTSALDDKNCERVISLLSDVAGVSGACLVIATHDHRLTSKIEQQILLQSQ